LQSKSKTVGRGRQAAKDDPTRKKLLAVARRIFADRGYQSATIREISAAAGANVAAVNYHFGDKLGLYVEVVQQSMQTAKIEAVQSVLDRSAPPEEILAEVIRTRVRNICRADRPNWHLRIQAHELTQPTPALRQRIDKVGRPLANRLLELIGKMIGLPAHDEKTRLCAVSAMGQMIVYVFADPLLKSVWPELKLTPDQVERIADHIVDVSLSYAKHFRSKTSGRSIQRTKRAVKPRAK
jgi:AcrR family transcriptional regulator